MYGLVSHSQTSANVWDQAQAAPPPPPTETDVFCQAYTQVYFSSVSVGSSAAE